jgi:hypothetical protein
MKKERFIPRLTDEADFKLDGKNQEPPFENSAQK